MKIRRRSFQPGFRLSVLDVVVLLLGRGASVSLFRIDQWFAIAVAFVVLHFFLFCNVLRMSRPLELVWAAFFVGMVLVKTRLEVVSWPSVFAAAIVATLTVTLLALRKPSYHGVGWRRLNPKLPQWWQANQAK
ncbi:MAG: hypothetical protein K1X67_07125 [Fimbriimonadaceae bacterium]|nr:hypothetical protein [Fimbriimonadaceae bacterium]